MPISYGNYGVTPLPLLELNPETVRNMRDFIAKFDDLIDDLEEQYEDSYNGWEEDDDVEFDGSKIAEMNSLRRQLTNVFPIDQKVSIRESELKELRALENRVKELEAVATRVKELEGVKAQGLKALWAWNALKRRANETTRHIDGYATTEAEMTLLSRKLGAGD